MKQKDLAIILAVAVVAVIFSVILARVAFATPKDRKQNVEVVEKISTEFPLPDQMYFNDNSINPTQLIRISENANQRPFNGSR